MLQIDMEMPKSCNKCPLTYEDEVDYHFCIFLRENIDYLLKGRKHPNCPLKEVQDVKYKGGEDKEC